MVKVLHNPRHLSEFQRVAYVNHNLYRTHILFVTFDALQHSKPITRFTDRRYAASKCFAFNRNLFIQGESRIAEQRNTIAAQNKFVERGELRFSEYDFVGPASSVVDILLFSLL